MNVWWTVLVTRIDFSKLGHLSFEEQVLAPSLSVGVWKTCVHQDEESHILYPNKNKGNNDKQTHFPSAKVPNTSSPSLGPSLQWEGCVLLLWCAFVVVVVVVAVAVVVVTNLFNYLSLLQHWKGAVWFKVACVASILNPDTVHLWNYARVHCQACCSTLELNGNCYLWKTAFTLLAN